MVYPALHTYFQHFPFRFYYVNFVFISHLVCLFDMMYYCCAMFESFAQLNSGLSLCTYMIIYYACHLHVLYMRHTPQYQLLLTNTICNLLLWSFPKHQYSLQLISVWTWVDVTDILLHTVCFSQHSMLVAISSK